MKTEKTTVSQHGCEGYLYTGDTKNRRCMILNLAFAGNSIFAKKTAAWLLTQSVDAFGLTSYGTKTTVPDQSEVPLDYIEAAVKYLKRQGYEKIGVMGLSFGAVMSMAAAARIPDLSLVIAMSGFDYVFEGVLGKSTQYPSGHSFFAWHGEEVPYQPFYLSKDEYIQMMNDAKKEHGEMYGRALWENSLKKKVNESAAIAVEDIKGKLVMFGAVSDTCWDTTGAAKRIEQRLLEKHADTELEIHSYEHACHFILPDCIPLISLMCRMAFKEWKTHTAECKAARTDVRKQIERNLAEWK